MRKKKGHKNFLQYVKKEMIHIKQGLRNDNTMPHIEICKNECTTRTKIAKIQKYPLMLM